MSRTIALTFAVLVSIQFTKAHAETLINVGISDLSAVTFTTTTAFASNTFLAESNNGILLRDFFDGNATTVQQDINSTISTYEFPDASSRLALDWIWVGAFPGGYTTNDVAFYEFSNNNDIYSFADQSALTGSAVFDFGGFSGMPGFGSSGNIYFGTPDQNQIIGQWSTVPEPSSATVIMASALWVAVRRRRG